MAHVLDTELELRRTWFASPERATRAQLQEKVGIAARSVFVGALLQVVKGLAAVLDEHRQIVAVNDEYLDALGLTDVASQWGLRPGEALGCSHASDHPGGCGTGPSCISCGAAIAIVTALSTDAPAERECVVRVQRPDGDRDLSFSVRAAPFAAEDMRFVLLLLEDNSRQKRRAALERVFLHDLANTAQVLVGSFELIVDPGMEALPEDYERAAAALRRLQREIAMQRALSREDAGDYPLRRRVVGVRDALDELALLCRQHPASRDREIEVDPPSGDCELDTDATLLERVLSNMVINALEASDPGQTVRVVAQDEGHQVTFAVWNHRSMPRDVASRVFLRNFSTKGGEGRGQGTFAMKLFGERHLGGRVGFTTAPATGTEFRLVLPKHLLH